MTKFTYDDGATHEKVELAAEFTEWSRIAMDHEAGSAYAKTVDLEPGKYMYKYIVDDEWRLKDGEPQVTDESGIVNHSLVVDEKEDDTAVSQNDARRDDVENERPTEERGEQETGLNGQAHGAGAVSAVGAVGLAGAVGHGSAGQKQDMLGQEQDFEGQEQRIGQEKSVGHLQDAGQEQRIGQEQNFEKEHSGQEQSVGQYQSAGQEERIRQEQDIGQYQSVGQEQSFGQQHVEKEHSGQEQNVGQYQSVGQEYSEQVQSAGQEHEDRIGLGKATTQDQLSTEQQPDLVASGLPAQDQTAMGHVHGLPEQVEQNSVVPEQTHNLDPSRSTESGRSGVVVAPEAPATVWIPEKAVQDDSEDVQNEQVEIPEHQLQSPVSPPATDTEGKSSRSSTKDGMNAPNRHQQTGASPLPAPEPKVAPEKTQPTTGSEDIPSSKRGEKDQLPKPATASSGSHTSPNHAGKNGRSSPGNGVGSGASGDGGLLGWLRRLISSIGSAIKRVFS